MRRREFAPNPRRQQGCETVAEALVRVGLKTPKRNAYAAPLAKAYAGAFAKFSPR
jgi:hypothetical protein